MAPQINSDPHALTPVGNVAHIKESNAANILGLVGTLGFLAVVVVAMRLYVRVRILKFVGTDDFLITASM
ncbi:hypothetical protein LTR22_028313, partial [Elasticomyces elasticus]